MQDALRRFKADIFQALAHPTQIAILEFLGEGELSAGELMGTSAWSKPMFLSI